MTGGARVTIYDRMPSVGRKFLLAGRGGLNLTHSEPFALFLSRYGEAAAHLRPAIEIFAPDRLRQWSAQLGQETFIGSSGRVFPKSFKASPLLRPWLRRLVDAGVRFELRHCWTGWTANGDLRFETSDGVRHMRADAIVLALGGASWPRLGSDGGWIDIIRGKGIGVAPLRPSNCGFRVTWTDLFRDRFEGQPLKSVAVSFAGQSPRGDVMITRDGIEGGPIYALSSRLRDAIDRSGEAILNIDLRPDTTMADLAAKLAVPRAKQSMANVLRKAGGLSPPAMGLVQEAAIVSGQRLQNMTAPALAGLIRNVPLRLTATAAIDHAISTAGGIMWPEIDAQFMLRKMSGVFVAGEMLDWEAPTGGYLLQASFATGAAAGRGALTFLKKR